MPGSTDVSGILNVNKSPGVTSADVVALVRKWSGVRRVGHAGTLDPMAVGVLLVCLGQATRVSEYLMALPKTYRAEIELGVETDTYDREGNISVERDVKGIGEEELSRALRHFEGVILQVPPKFSAIKVAGRPAYRRARQGEEFELQERTVRIDRLELVRFEPPVVEIEIECGKGTYIRSLASDIGKYLGCGAVLNALTRRAVGPFRLESATPLAQLERLLANEGWKERLSPVDSGLGYIPAIVISGAREDDFRHGRRLNADDIDWSPPSGSEGATRLRVYGEDQRFLGILLFDEDARVWRAEKVFAPI